MTATPGDAIALVTAVLSGVDGDLVLDDVHLQQTAREVGQVYGYLAGLCAALCVDLARERGVTPWDVLREVALVAVAE